MKPENQDQEKSPANSVSVAKDFVACTLLRAVAMVWLCCAVGCSNWLPEPTTFGEVSGYAAKRSINGLGIHRKMWEMAGAKVLTPQKLSPKLETFDVIVLVGQSYAPPGDAARRWLEDWLAKAPGRSVVYFGRDFNAEVQYRRATLDLIEPELRDRGEFKLAEAESRELQLRLRQLPEGTFCGWFYLEAALPTSDVTQFSGPWSSVFASVDSATSETSSWPVGVRLLPPDKSLRSRKPSWLTTKPGANLLKPASQVIFGPGNNDSSLQRSAWTYGELDTVEAWDEAFDKAPQFETLLASSDDVPLVFRLGDDAYPDGQILVVANGAPILNGSLVQPLNRALGEKIIESCLPAQRVALIAYDETGLLISQAPEADSRAAGLEMLTVWPLSAITMPAALLGIIICAVLFPILGRPQRAPVRSVGDFGLHAEALGSMLADSRDLPYAKSVISEYFEKVRGEMPPGWLEQYGRSAEAPATSPAPPIVAAPPAAKIQSGSTPTEPRA